MLLRTYSPKQPRPDRRLTAIHSTEERMEVMKLDSMQDLLADELKDLYSAENQLLKALPKMAKAASASELRMAFEDHLAETQTHVERLTQVCEALEISPGGKKCEAMEGLIAEGAEVIAAEGDAAVKDAALIASAQRVEHYEIAGYGCARTFAQTLGFSDEADLLQQTLDEEGITDKRLTELAESLINAEAAHAEGD
jgi:ferritin-like metal-binding protein YciE